MADRIIAANTVILKIGATKIGGATAVRIEERLQIVDLGELGETDPIGHAVTARQVRGSMDRLKFFRKPLEQIGYWPINKRALHEWPPITFAIHDKVTKEPIVVVERFLPESRVFAVTYGGVMTTNTSFRGIGIFTEGTEEAA